MEWDDEEEWAHLDPEVQLLSRKRFRALQGVRLTPGKADTRWLREIYSGLACGWEVTARQAVALQALAWRYRRQIHAALVPYGPVALPERYA